MPFLKFKSNVVVPKTVIIAAAAINAALEVGLANDLVITSGNDSVHMKGSLHYMDKALDFRTHSMSDDEKAKFISVFQRRLGQEYQLIFEDKGGPNEHLHCEFDPKRDNKG